jgi:hypothetical protein
MSRYFEISCHSIISSYGGIGSLVETPKGSLLILPLEKWPYFIYEVDGKDREHLESISVRDPRLIQRLRTVFKDLTYLLSIPINATTKGGYHIRIENNLVSAEYFPKWMFCPHCLRFMKYEDWLQRYRMAHLGKDFDLYCPECQKPGSGHKPASILLEQVRFISVTEEGEIEDFPWEEWFNLRATGNHDCEKHEFNYKTSPYSDNLESIRIHCKKCKSTASLIGIFGKNFDKERARTVLKSSNSVYFPSIVRSLMIPMTRTTNTSYSESEMYYRCQELEYMVGKSNADDYDENDLINLKSMPSQNKNYSLISIRSLNMASVLCSYSRLQPVSFGTIYELGKSRHVTLAGYNTRFLPTVPSAGEGFLIVFNDAVISRWYSLAKDNPGFTERLEAHKKGLAKFNPFDVSDKSEYTLCKYILLHTISHLLIKQLEYVCGYPAASMNERIYVSGNNHSGIMVYTVSGSEGSYGGIVTIVEKGDISQIMLEAFEKGKFCSNDPVCYSNSSICFSCGLLPETSCESFNSLLDRSFVVDFTYGFAGTLIT